jgi:hypothetical protein
LELKANQNPAHENALITVIKDKIKQTTTLSLEWCVKSGCKTDDACDIDHAALSDAIKS